MKRSENSFWLLAPSVALLVLALNLVACSDDESGGHSTPDQDAASDSLEDQQTTNDAAEVGDVEPDPVPDQTQDLSLDQPLDVDPIDHEPPCGSQPQLATCDATYPAPTSDAQILEFALDNAIALLCLQEDELQWEFGIYLDEFADMKVFMMGELHGSNEIGPASLALFETLWQEGMVEIAALEIGMDATAAITEFIQTGSGPFISLYGYNTYGLNMFRRIFPDHARELYQAEGIFIPVVGIDTPQRLAWVNEQLSAIAEGISDETTRGLILDNMPAPKEQEDYGFLGLPTTYVEACESYYQHIVDNLETICPELTDDDACEELEFMAYALWIGAVFNSQDFMMEMIMGGESLSPQAIEWMDLREELIFYNFRRLVREYEGGIFSHMGAAHVAKGGDMEHIGRMLDEDFEPTQGRVYSVVPAYGPNSSVFYTFMAMDAPPEPAVIANQMAELPLPNYFLTSTKPGFDCTANPFSSIGEALGLPGSHYGHWDSFFWFRRLTPDTPSHNLSKINLTPSQRWTMENTRRMQVAARAAWGSLR